MSYWSPADAMGPNAADSKAGLQGSLGVGHVTPNHSASTGTTHYLLKKNGIPMAQLYQSYRI